MSPMPKGYRETVPLRRWDWWTFTLALVLPLAGYVLGRWLP